MKVFVTIIFILISVALTAIILMQEGKDAGLGTIGGIGETYWAKNKSSEAAGCNLPCTCHSFEYDAGQEHNGSHNDSADGSSCFLH